jgi:hypothetical protein
MTRTEESAEIFSAAGNWPRSELAFRPNACSNRDRAGWFVAPGFRDWAVAFLRLAAAGAPIRGDLGRRLAYYAAAVHPDDSEAAWRLRERVLRLRAQRRLRSCGRGHLNDPGAAVVDEDGIEHCAARVRTEDGWQPCDRVVGADYGVSRPGDRPGWTPRLISEPPLNATKRSRRLVATTGACGCDRCRKYRKWRVLLTIPRRLALFAGVSDAEWRFEHGANVTEWWWNWLNRRRRCPVCGALHGLDKACRAELALVGMSSGLPIGRPSKLFGPLESRGAWQGEPLPTGHGGRTFDKGHEWMHARVFYHPPPRFAALIPPPGPTYWMEHPPPAPPSSFCAICGRPALIVGRLGDCAAKARPCRACSTAIVGGLVYRGVAYVCAAHREQLCRE